MEPSLMPNIRARMPMQAIVLALLAVPAAAPADECFCVIDADDNIWFDCVDYRPPSSPRTTFFCRSVIIDGRIAVPSAAQLQRVAATAAPCTPCRLTDGALRAGIRGDGDQEPTDGTKIEDEQ